MSSIVLMAVSAYPARGESAYDRGRRHGVGAVMVNTIVLCLVAEGWITEEGRDAQMKKWMDYYQAKLNVPDSAMASFANHPNYYGAIDGTIKNLGGCQKILDRQWNVN